MGSTEHHKVTSVILVRLMTRQARADHKEQQLNDTEFISCKLLLLSVSMEEVHHINRQTCVCQDTCPLVPQLCVIHMLDCNIGQRQSEIYVD